MITLAPPRGGGGITARGVPGQRRCQGSCTLPRYLPGTQDRHDLPGCQFGFDL